MPAQPNTVWRMETARVIRGGVPNKQAPKNLVKSLCYSPSETRPWHPLGPFISAKPGTLANGVFLPNVAKTRYLRTTRSWVVIPDTEPTPAGADVTLEVSERRMQLKRQNWAFIERLRAAILVGLETPAGVLGHEYGPRRGRRRR
jgi:hypothetical protein